jgi:16S rRNA (guanine527-N7)-methyltransferase
MHFDTRVPTILNLGFRKEGIPMLKAYLDLLWRSNEDLNLISRKMTSEDLIDNHVIDCLLPLRFLAAEVSSKVSFSVADFGSGGGLPGVLYAIQFPNIHFHLFEKSNKKQDFLKRVRAALVSNLSVHAEIPSQLPETNLVVARGFKPLDGILNMSRAFYKGGGKFFLLKGRVEKIEEEITLAREKFPDLSIRIERLISPVLEVERHLVVAQKNSK